MAVSVEGLEGIENTLRAKTLKHRKQADIVVGYSAPYSLYVHENLEMIHTVGNAKFLERPMRTQATNMRKIVKYYLQNKESLEYACQKAGEFLLEKSQEQVPIDTGFLLRSGYVRIDSISATVKEGS